MVANILVVDDERNIVQLARLYLGNEGFRVEEANDGKQALIGDSQGFVRIWDFAKGKELQAVADHGTAAVFTATHKAAGMQSRLGQTAKCALGR